MYVSSSCQPSFYYLMFTSIVLAGYHLEFIWRFRNTGDIEKSSNEKIKARKYLNNFNPRVKRMVLGFHEEFFLWKWGTL